MIGQPWVYKTLLLRDEPHSFIRGGKDPASYAGGLLPREHMLEVLD